MRSYTITVNGKVYDVTVEETTQGAVPAAKPAVAAPVATKIPQQTAPAGAGNIKITAGAAGKVFDIVAAPGANLKKGDTIMVLEVMKMETPVVATEDGVLASIDVTKGQPVEAGDLLATLK